MHSPKAQSFCHPRRHGGNAAYKEELDRFLSGTLENTAGEDVLFPVYYTVIESVSVDGKIRNIRYLSPACHLFGMIGDTNEDSMTGKLRFTDLDIPECADPEDYYYHDNYYCDSNGMVTLQELSISKNSGITYCERHEPNDTEIPKLFGGMDEKSYYEEGCGFSMEMQPQFQMLTKFLNGENTRAFINKALNAEGGF